MKNDLTTTTICFLAREGMDRRLVMRSCRLYDSTVIVLLRNVKVPQGPLVMWPCVARWEPPVARFGLIWPDSDSSGQKEPTSRQPDFRFPILNTCHAHDTAHDTAQQPFFLASTPPWTGHCPPHCTLLIMCFKSKGSVRALHHTFTCASDWIASAGCSALPHVQHCWANAGTVQARVHSALQVQQPEPLLF